MTTRQGEISPPKQHVVAMVIFDNDDVEYAINNGLAIQAFFFVPALKSLRDAGSRPRLKEVADTPAPTIEEVNHYAEKIGLNELSIESESQIGDFVLKLARLGNIDGRNVVNNIIDKGQANPKPVLSNIVSMPVPEFAARLTLEETWKALGGTISEPLRAALDTIEIPAELVADFCGGEK